MSYARVRLEWYEVEQAVHVGGRREAEALRKAIDAPQHSKEPSIENHIQSAGAEIAVAKFMNAHWTATINTFRNGPPDVGRATEVRWRRGEYELIVREKDHDDRFYVLVRGALPEYLLIGWILGRNAKRLQWRKNHGEYGPAFFVPEKYLQPMSRLQTKAAPSAANPIEMPKRRNS